MKKIIPFRLSSTKALSMMRAAAKGETRLLFSEHAEVRMRQRKIGRRQGIDTLAKGSISEPLHQDVRGDWRCDVGWFHAGVRLTVGVIFKLNEKGDWVVVATVFKEN